MRVAEWASACLLLILTISVVHIDVQAPRALSLHEADDNSNYGERRSLGSATVVAQTRFPFHPRHSALLKGEGMNALEISSYCGTLGMDGKVTSWIMSQPSYFSFHSPRSARSEWLLPA